MIEDVERHVQERRAECLSDPRTNEELVSLALAEADEDKAWEAVTILHYRASREVLDLAGRLCESECPQERSLGANVLGQLGVPKRSFPDESLAVLLELIERDDNADVLNAACVALGHLHDPRAIGPLAGLRNHVSAGVRHGVVVGLAGYEDALAVRTLIALSDDADDLVRDWATFGLGSQIETDTPEIRDALFRRLKDPDHTTRGEALVGLARRKDSRVVEPLIEALLAGFEGSLILEAAAEIGDPRLLPFLVDLRTRRNRPDEALEEAIRKCAVTL